MQAPNIDDTLGELERDVRAAVNLTLRVRVTSRQNEKDAAAALGRLETCLASIHRYRRDQQLTDGGPR